MSPFIVSIYNSIVFVIYCYLGSHIILKKTDKKNKKLILAVISLFITYYFILCLLNSIYSIFFSGITAFIFIRIIFQESIYMSLFISILLNTTKILNKILILEIINNDSYLLLNTYKTLDLSALYINSISMALSIILLLILRKKIWKIIKYISSRKNRKLILLTAIYANFILIYIYQPPYEVLTIKAMTDIIVILGVTCIGILSISGEMKMENLTKHYQEMYEYSRANAELLKEYKMQVHENKNNLLMIKGMLDEDNQNIKEYIDIILKEIDDSKINTNYWLTELQNIPLPGIRNFINYKLIKLRDLGAEIEVFISSEMKNVNPSFLPNKDYNQLTTILGVILDNMIEAIKETDKKLISINIYLESNKIHGEFVNTFANQIDMNRLSEIGYTTKGKRHGVGLSLVAKIVKMNKRFECNPRIMDDFFCQHLTIKVNNKNKTQKKPKK